MSSGLPKMASPAADQAPQPPPSCVTPQQIELKPVADAGCSDHAFPSLDFRSALRRTAGLSPNEVRGRVAQRPLTAPLPALPILRVRGGGTTNRSERNCLVGCRALVPQRAPSANRSVGVLADSRLGSPFALWLRAYLMGSPVCQSASRCWAKLSKIPSSLCRARWRSGMASGSTPARRSRTSAWSSKIRIR